MTAAQNAEKLFKLAQQFVPPHCRQGHELISDIDVDLSNDFLKKLKEAQSVRFNFSLSNENIITQLNIMYTALS